jgi:thioredoxin 1
MREPTEIRKRLLFIIGLITIVAVVLVAKGQRQASDHFKNEAEKRPAVSRATEPSRAENLDSSGPRQPAVLPRLIDLGADKCIPCKMMAPILEELKVEYRGRFEVDVIDVWKKPEAGRQWRIRVIPTQIFIDQSGKELYRHEGFFSKEYILKKWKELGVDVEWK